ncbi:glycoside hydrolase family 43 protein [Echinicola jeungdonensis]|uniref:Glycoside hydrolase family 43 protein n=1 Tax=Echinicola jeungdonensis TaxID=709343 RepID=A0ABV5J639_9BACT|nr:glycoside hydrolase family 43 protein [Echinicola jeungdonensis]MDN3668029.1 glycoside hydrolase family 43 protein [Echinicola jeungdonensis]
MKTLIKTVLPFVLAVTPYLAEAQQAGKSPYSSYLFAFFSNNTPEGEQVRYAISEDGLNYKSLNDGRPVISSDKIALKKSIRDPHIMRAEDGKTFYMVLTDMRSSEGWQSNDGLVLMKSTDLLHWEHTNIDFPTRFPDLEGFDRENLHAVWAPQTIWDPEKEQYLIYYSIGRHDWEYPVGDRYQPYFKIFYSYVNEDFTDITEPKLLFDFGTAAIDGDIVFDHKNNEFVLFFKDEGIPADNNGFRTNNGVMRATSKNLTGPYDIEYRHLHNTEEAPVEGSSVFPLIGSDEYILMYDCYIKGYYQFCKSDDLKNFTFVQNTATEGNFTPRHGSVMHITDKERSRLEAWSKLKLTLHEIEQTPKSDFTAKQFRKIKALKEKADVVLSKSSKTQKMLKINKMLIEASKK